MNTGLQEHRDSRLTVSRLRTAQTCLKKHYWLYILGLRPDREAPPLRIGRVFHRGLELAAQIGEADGILLALADYDAGPPAEADEAQAHAWWVERETVGRLLTGHVWRWTEQDAGMEVVATEEAFDIPLVNPETGRSSRTWTVAGKRDKIVRLPGDRLAVLEYKTTSDDIDPASDYWLRLRMDSQVSIYWLAAVDAGLPVETVLYDVTRKPTIRPRQVPTLDEDGVKIVVDAAGGRIFNANGKPRLSASSKDGWTLLSRPETPLEFGARLTEDLGFRSEFYFARKEIPRLESDLDEARFELWQMGKMLRDCERHGRWPRNTDACMGFGRCVCWDLCTDGFDPAEGVVPEGWKQVDDVHQELIKEKQGHGKDGDYAGSAAATGRQVDDTESGAAGGSGDSEAGQAGSQVPVAANRAERG